MNQDNVVLDQCTLVDLGFSRSPGYVHCAWLLLGPFPQDRDSLGRTRIQAYPG